MCPAHSPTPASRSPGAIILPAVQATADMVFEPATRPTMYFIGVTTGKSSIMSVFPKWAALLGLGKGLGGGLSGGLSGGLGEVALRGIDCKWHDDPAVYRRVVQFIKNDPLSLGALVTTHKIDLLTACRDLFDTLDPHAELLGEISSISKQRVEGVSGNHVLLVGHAKDMITSGLSLESFLPDGHWTRSGADAVILGAGGSSIALSCALLDRRHGDNVPRRLFVTNRSPGRLREIEAIHRKIGVSIPVEYIHTPHPEDNDRVLDRVAAGSLVANATGLGKDAPGSPLTDAAVFPEQGFAWDFNYRGDLLFLVQARRQAAARQLHVEDGWVYFLHGWTRVIAEVFHIDIPVRGPEFEKLGEIAATART